MAGREIYSIGDKMRDIKFRAWDKKKKRYAKLWTVEFGHDGIDDMLAITEEDGSVTISEEFILEEYIGLKDKKSDKDVYNDDYCLIRVDFSQPNAEKSQCENLKVHIFYDDELFTW